MKFSAKNESIQAKFSKKSDLSFAILPMSSSSNSSTNVHFYRCLLQPMPAVPIWMIE